MRCRPPDGLSLIYEASGLAFWRYSNSRFDFDSLISDGTAILAIRTPPGVMETLPKSPRRPPQRMGTDVRALTALRGVQYHLQCNACRPAKNVRNLTADFTLSDDVRARESSD